MVPLSVESQLLAYGRIKQYFLKNKMPSFQNIAHILKGYGHEFRHFKLSFGYVFAYIKKVSDLDLKWM